MTDEVTSAVRGSSIESGANLSGASLSRADLSGAHLSGAHLSRAHLRGANLSDATVRYARFISRAGLSEEAKQDLIQRGAIFDAEQQSDQ